jgi:chaperonin GroES
MKVLNNRVFLKLDKTEDVTKGGIIVPISGKELLEKATVWKAGEKCEVLKEGDRVLVHYADGRDVTIDNIKYILIREHDVSCKIED